MMHQFVIQHWQPSFAKKRITEIEKSIGMFKGRESYSLWAIKKEATHYYIHLTYKSIAKPFKP